MCNGLNSYIKMNGGMRECYEIRIHAYIENSDTGQHTIHAQHVPSSSPSLNCLYIKYNDACIMPKNYELRVYAYFFAAAALFFVSALVHAVPKPCICDLQMN